MRAYRFPTVPLRRSTAIWIGSLAMANKSRWLERPVYGYRHKGGVFAEASDDANGACGIWNGGGNRAAYDCIHDVDTKVAAQVDDGPCVTYVGEGGSGNFVKMNNGIEYGDMQLISEAYAVLKCVGGLSNRELADTFAEWNRGELESFLIEIIAICIFQSSCL